MHSNDHFQFGCIAGAGEEKTFAPFANIACRQAIAWNPQKFFPRNLHVRSFSRFLLRKFPLMHRPSTGEEDLGTGLGDTLSIHVYGANITAHPTRTERAKRAQSLYSII